MTTCPTLASAIPEMDGELTYPRSNGEPVFAAPWQSRAFGMIVDLHKAGQFSWDEFKQRLIAEIRAGRPADAPSDASECWRVQIGPASRALPQILRGTYLKPD
jgi:nitrile hydratase accessory protein